MPPRRRALRWPFLPFRSPELMPLEDLWRGLKATVAANRCYSSLEELTDRAVDWLTSMSEEGPAPPLRVPVLQVRLATYLAGTRGSSR
jgi:hypothetical protein